MKEEEFIKLWLDLYNKLEYQELWDQQGVLMRSFIAENYPKIAKKIDL
jgi:hypothetical protein